MSAVADTPIFVVGYMHSGTTLLHNILAAHPAVFAAADETRYFAYLPFLSGLYPDLRDDSVLDDLALLLADLIQRGQPARLRSLARRWRPEPEDAALSAADLAAIRVAAQPRTYGVAFRAVLDHLAARAGKTRWLEKTPQHVFLIDEILRGIPDARFVEIVRDPRDNLASKKKRKQAIRTATQLDRAQQRIRTLERVYDPFWDALEWRLAVRAGQDARHAHPDRLHSLRYEDLIAQPETIVRAVCAFLGLDFAPEMLDVRWWNAAEGDRSERKGIVADALGRWAQTLTPAEVALAQRVAGGPFRRAGYTPAPTPLRAWLGIPWLLLRAGVGLIERLVRRWQLGGPRFLLNTLVNYGKALRRLLTR